mmetsp:Transcript_3303/g.5127  ORF Transcript_3303/g.5127 Transcript_3303/m.5127 type:complete len:384 (-) Transcript_3303:21-1172(-)
MSNVENSDGNNRRRRSSIFNFPSNPFAVRNSKGLADALNTTYLPSMVSDEMKGKASLTYFSLLVLYFIFAIVSVVYALRARQHPAIQYTKKMSETDFKAPYLTYCVHLKPYYEYPEFWFETRCEISAFYQSTRDCDFSHFEIVTGYDKKCCVFEFNENLMAVGGKMFLWMYVRYDDNDTLPYFTFYDFYISDFKPENGIKWDEEKRFFDLGMYRNQFQYEVEVSKLTKTSLNPSWGGLKISPKDEVSYNTQSHYAAPWDWEGYALVLYLRANFQGVEIMKEIDSLNFLSLIGTIAGLSPYIAIIFMFVFRKSIHAHMKKLERTKIDEKMDEVGIEMHVTIEQRFEEMMESSKLGSVHEISKTIDEQHEILREMLEYFQKKKNV